MIKLMYITNNVDIAKIAENAGVERIFVDMEYIGKDLRQGGKDTVQNHHTIADVKRIKGCLTRAELLVRCNPIHDKIDGYSSKEEIDAIVESGADAIMLPYFKTADEVKVFIDLVGGRAKTVPLIETPEAVEVIDEILKIEGIDEIFIGLNDLSLGYGKTFMFELLSDGTVEGVKDIVLDGGIHKDHNDLLLGLNGDVEELLGLGVSRSAGADDGTAAGAEFLCRIHNGIGEACVYYAKYNFMRVIHF